MFRSFIFCKRYTQAFSVLSKHGSATWSEFPYQTSTSPATNYREWSLNPVVWRNAIRFRSDSSGTISNVHQPEGRENLKAMLNNGYIVNFLNYITSMQYSTVGNDPDYPDDGPFVGQHAALWG